jgi:hypothetical protein
MRIATVLVSLLPVAQAVAQEPLETKLSITQGGRESGREEFTYRQGRAGGAPGSKLIAAARYPATNPTAKLTANLERTPEGALAKFQLDVEGPNGTVVILAAGSGARLIIRTVAKGSEAGRELPGGPDVVLLDDQVFSLYSTVADLATPAGRRLTAASFVAQREGSVVNLSGDIRGSLESDANGLVSLVLLESGTRVSRVRD